MPGSRISPGVRQDNMANAPDSNIGKIVWQDLTVPNAEEVRAFYEGVIGWRTEPLEMDGYSDYVLFPPGSKDAVGGVCFARGSNADLPTQWLLYIRVADVDASAAACTTLGGSVVIGPREMGSDRFCVVRDPAGAVCALLGPTPLASPA